MRRPSLPALALAADAVLLAAFAAIGRRNHDEGDAVAGVVSTAWPFLAGWLVAAIAVGLLRRPLSLQRALAAWAIALPLALAARALSRGHAPPLSFAIVALAFTLVTLVGWRVLVGTAGRARRRAEAVRP
jgi:hypothetical protein